MHEINHFRLRKLPNGNKYSYVSYDNHTDNYYYEIRAETSTALVSNLIYILPNIRDY